MDMTGRDMVNKLKKDGWKEVRVEGSHHIMKKDGLTISVPVHGNKSLKKVC